MKYLGYVVRQEEEIRKQIQLQGDFGSMNVFQQEIFVSPGTSELEIVMFRAKTEGNVGIITPGGINKTIGNYGPTDMLETPFVSIWKFTDPPPGKWLFKISDYNSGLLSILHRNKVDYNIKCMNRDIFQQYEVEQGKPTEESGRIQAAKNKFSAGGLSQNTWLEARDGVLNGDGSVISRVIEVGIIRL